MEAGESLQSRMVPEKLDVCHFRCPAAASGALRLTRLQFRAVCLGPLSSTSWPLRSLQGTGLRDNPSQFSSYIIALTYSTCLASNICNVLFLLSRLSLVKLLLVNTLPGPPDLVEGTWVARRVQYIVVHQTLL